MTSRCLHAIFEEDNVKRLSLLILLILWSPLEGYTQGWFLLLNYTAPTRIGSIDGPLAGAGIWAQALGGFAEDSLTPIGVPVEHDTGGFVNEEITVPWAPRGNTIFVQMLVWDGGAWGTSFVSVPTDQFGQTDIVQVFLSGPLEAGDIPEFTQSAIVPPIPEPSEIVMAILGAALFLILRGRMPRSTGVV